MHAGNYGGDINDCDFEKERGKVHLQVSLNNERRGVWRDVAWMDRFWRGRTVVGCLEYDEKRAAEEDALLRDQLERYTQRVNVISTRNKGRTESGATQQPPHLKVMASPSPSIITPRSSQPPRGGRKWVLEPAEPSSLISPH